MTKWILGFIAGLFVHMAFTAWLERPYAVRITKANNSDQYFITERYGKPVLPPEPINITGGNGHE